MAKLKADLIIDIKMLEMELKHKNREIELTNELLKSSNEIKEILKEKSFNHFLSEFMYAIEEYETEMNTDFSSLKKFFEKIEFDLQHIQHQMIELKDLKKTLLNKKEVELGFEEELSLDEEELSLDEDFELDLDEEELSLDEEEIELDLDEELSLDEEEIELDD